MAQAPQQITNVSLNKMAAMLPMMPDAELAQLTSSPMYGALALTEVAKRDRINTMQQAQTGVGGGNLREALLAKLAADDRFGLNNIVAQAEQGAIDFGGQEEPMEMAGGGMIAFEEGGRIKQTQDGKRYFDNEELGRVYKDGSLGYAAAGLIPAITGIASKALPYGRAGIQYLRDMGTAARSLSPRQRMIAGTGLSTAASAPFMFGEEGPEGPPVSDTYPEEFERGSAKDAAKVADLAEAAQGAKNEKEAARGIADLLGGNTTASDILKERRRLEEEAGLGEYGAGVKEKQAKRRAETEEKFGKEKTIQALVAAAEAAGAGGRRLSGLGALAAAATGGSKGALAAMKEERAALEKLDEAQEKMAMAEDLYRRGDIASAQKMAAEAQQQQQANALKLRQIQSTETYQGLMAQAALARASKATGVKAGDAINAIARSNELRQRLSMLTDPKDPAQAAEIQAIQQQLQMLKIIAASGTMGGAIPIEDVPDEA